jgi:hypothetical protein
MQKLSVFGCCLLARCTLWGGTPLSALTLHSVRQYTPVWPHVALSEAVHPCLPSRCTLWGGTPLSAITLHSLRQYTPIWPHIALSEAVHPCLRQLLQAVRHEEGSVSHNTLLHSNKRFDTVFKIKALTDFSSNYDTEFSASPNCLYHWSNIEAILRSPIETQNPAQLTRSTVPWQPAFPLSSPISIPHPTSSFFALEYPQGNFWRDFKNFNYFSFFLLKLHKSGNFTNLKG